MNTLPRNLLIYQDELRYEMRLLLIIGLWLPIWASAQSVFPLSLSDLKDHPALYQPAREFERRSYRISSYPISPVPVSSKTLNDGIAKLASRRGLWSRSYSRQVPISEVAHSKATRIAFPLFVDKDQAWSRKIGAAVVTEVFLFDRQVIPFIREGSTTGWS